MDSPVLGVKEEHDRYFQNKYKSSLRSSRAASIITGCSEGGLAQVNH